MQTKTTMKVLAIASVSVATLALTTLTSWGYHGNVGPDDWCGLDPSFSACCEGVEQSPIDIVTDDAEENEDMDAIATSYSDCEALSVIHNGHTIQANVPSGNTLTVGDTTYTLLQFHFHTESEHTIDGAHRPIEMHLVHQSSSGALAVIGVMIEKGDKNVELAKVWRDFPHEDGPAVSVTGFDINEILPEDRESYRYGGSLTTPPCSEGVSWIVLADSIEMSRRQINSFKTLFSGSDFPHGNRRPVKPLNSRVVTTDAD